MLNTSLRRVARTCPNTSIPTRFTSPSNSSQSTATFSTRCHQRRHSSSKPPVPPNNGAPSIPAASVKQVGAPRSSDKRATVDTRLSKRRVAKGGEKVDASKTIQKTRGNDWTLQLPSVPSTQHLNPKDVYVASFFSTHRPISISGPLPPETQIDDIDKIFQARPKRPRHGPADVIYTLNSAVQSLEDGVHRGQQHGQQNEQHMVEQRADLIKALTQQNNAPGDGNQTTHLDGQSQRGHGTSVKVAIQDIARLFRPFHAPPPPVPVSNIDLMSKEPDTKSTGKGDAAAGTFELEIQRRDGGKMVLQLNNVHRTSDLKSGQFFTSRSIISDPTSKINITEPSTQPARGGRLRRGMYVDPRRNLRNLRYYAISVKRQRKLKMKKHKYKKLMRKTRNLRRRQDKL